MQSDVETGRVERWSYCSPAANEQRGDEICKVPGTMRDAIGSFAQLQCYTLRATLHKVLLPCAKMTTTTVTHRRRNGRERDRQHEIRRGTLKWAPTRGLQPLTGQSANPACTSKKFADDAPPTHPPTCLPAYSPIHSTHPPTRPTHPHAPPTHTSHPPTRPTHPPTHPTHPHAPPGAAHPRGLPAQARRGSRTAARRCRPASAT